MRDTVSCFSLCHFPVREWVLGALPCFGFFGKWWKYTCSMDLIPVHARHSGWNCTKNDPTASKLYFSLMVTWMIWITFLLGNRVGRKKQRPQCQFSFWDNLWPSSSCHSLILWGHYHSFYLIDKHTETLSLYKKLSTSHWKAGPELNSLFSILDLSSVRDSRNFEVWSTGRNQP